MAEIPCLGALRKEELPEGKPSFEGVLEHTGPDITHDTESSLNPGLNYSTDKRTSETRIDPLDFARYRFSDSNLNATPVLPRWNPLITRNRLGDHVHIAL